jgi:SAM-dependent methyltransferase
MRRASSRVTSTGVLSVKEFVLANLPPAPARVLEVGCGNGDLARALEEAGYDVVAIDPAAPDGAIFRRIKLEDLEEDERFDAVVAARVFHHMGENLEPNLERVARALEGGGPFVVEEFAPDRLDAATADWYEGQRRALAAAGRANERPGAAEWEAHHSSVTPSDVLLPAFRRHFDERSYEDLPYLWRYVDGVVSPDLEQSLVDAGAIRPLGYRFVGMPRARSSFQEL